MPLEILFLIAIIIFRATVSTVTSTTLKSVPLVSTRYVTDRSDSIHQRGHGSSRHDLSPCSGLCSAHPVHPSVPASKQHLHTQRVSHKYRPFSLECHQLCIASIRHHVYGIPPSTSMAPRYAVIGLGVDRIQLRAGIISSMLLDSVPSEAIFPIEAMGGCVSNWSMACCKYRMHACLRQLAAGRNRYCVPIVR